MKIHISFLYFMPFVLIQEQNDHQHHEHDSLHVDDEIHEEIYAKKNQIKHLKKPNFLYILYVLVEFFLQLQVSLVQHVFLIYDYTV